MATAEEREAAREWVRNHPTKVPPPTDEERWAIPILSDDFGEDH